MLTLGEDGQVSGNTHQCLHELIEAQEAVASRHTRHLIVLLNTVGLHTLMVDDERHGLVDMYAQLHRRRMVRQDGYADGLRHLQGSLVDGTYQPLVQIVDGTQLEVEVAVVACLVSRFDMDEDEVIMLQGVDGCLRLAFVVGIG